MVRQKVESGRYNNASEVVREALRLMEERDALQRLRADVAAAQEQFDRGEGREYTPELHAEILETARKRAREGEQPRPDVLP
jgi:antitoxin ParD1/3/4